ncbi:MAG: hypothetical protein C0469_18330 [Cyanobacteria bacterium DS2.3.42]|nr:hypothetical protein [Cyanobacteria bacterium DS2.3.42]
MKPLESINLRKCAEILPVHPQSLNIRDDVAASHVPPRNVVSQFLEGIVLHLKHSGVGQKSSAQVVHGKLPTAFLCYSLSPEYTRHDTRCGFSYC